MYVKMRLTLFLIAGWFVMASALGQSSPPRLTVASGGHTLLHDKLDAQGQTPFFWLGDTAWELFSALNQNEAIRYLDDRAGKKFTVVQAHLLPWELTELNALGQTVFVDNDFDRPNEAYWQHVDFIVQQASQRGLYLALLPAWCRTYIEPKGSPLHSDSLKAYRYGRFLGQRYRAYPNLIWVLGGDKLPTRHTIYRHLAKGLTETYADGQPDRILFTYHPPGGTWRPPATSSGEFFHAEPWLDFNMIQSGHAKDNASYERIRDDYNRQPTKPTLDAEPCYEQHPVKHKYENGLFSARDVRRRGYWSLLAGACGFTYGGNGVWQMDKPSRVRQATHFKDYWYDALNYEGAGQMRHLRRLAETYRWHTWIPDTTLLTGSLGRIDDRIQSVRAADNSCFIHYSTNGRPIAITPLPAGRWSYHWFDPRTGIASQSKQVKTMKFTPPSAGTDWLLVLTNEASFKNL